MKRLLLLLAVCALQGCSAWAADPTITFATSDSARMNTTTGYIDWAQVSTKRGSRLINVFGYNSGSQQWIQLFDSTNGPTVAVTAWSASSDFFTASAGHGLYTGQPIQLTGTVAGIAAGIYYVGTVDASGGDNLTNFFLYDTRAHAVAGFGIAGNPGLKDLTGGTSTATMNLVPKHTFAIAAADNYSCIVPSTGIGFGRGIVVAASTTGPLYTAPSTNVTICASYLP